eukprot:scaffold678_cov98-Cylindrotheca_fusiformis.AAC.6
MAHRVSQVLFRRQMFRHRGSLVNAANAAGNRTQRLFDPRPVVATGAAPAFGTHRLFDPTPVVAPAFVQSRSMSSFGGGSPSLTANPSYQIYGENAAFTMKCIMPTFRVVGNKNRPTVFVDNKQKGRLLFEFTPRSSNGGGGGGTKFAWDRPLRFALSAEEVGTLLAALSSLQPVEFARQNGGAGGQQYGFHGGANDNNISGSSLQKVFRAIPNMNNGSIQFTIDYELDGRGGQDPPNPNEAPGPMEISLMTGEYLVIKSLMEYAIPRLVGWPQMMDRPLEQLVQTNNYNNNQNDDDVPSPHNYSRGSGGVPF